MYRVLLADDEPMTKIGIRTLIAPLEDEYQLIGTVSNGVEALEFIAQNDVDILITDLVMPHMDGIELIKSLREAQNPCQILVLSNYSDFELVRQALLSGAADYMLKINITTQTLASQLKKAASQLDTARKRRQDMAQNESILAQSRQIKYEQALRDYITSASKPDADAELERRWKNGIQVFDIYYSPQNPEKRIPAQGVTELLQSIFEKTPPVILPLDAGRSFVMTDAAQSYAGGDAKEKALQIIRQLSIYCALDVTVFLPSPASNLDAARERYLSCLAARGMLFYGRGQGVIDPEQLRFSGLPEGTSSLDAARSMRGICYRPNELRAYLDGLVGQCAKRPASPDEVRVFFLRSIEQLRNDALYGADASQAAPIGPAIMSAATAGELIETVMRLIPEISTEGLSEASYKKEIRLALGYIRFNYDRRLTLEEIASAVNLNPSYLCRLFKSQTGENLFGLINRLRMTKAGALITEGEIYVKQVAAAVGIDDAFYFTRLFKKHYGMSPSQYQIQTRTTANK